MTRSSARVDKVAHFDGWDFIPTNEDDEVIRRRLELAAKRGGLQSLEVPGGYSPPGEARNIPYGALYDASRAVQRNPLSSIYGQDVAQGIIDASTGNPSFLSSLFAGLDLPLPTSPLEKALGAGIGAIWGASKQKRIPWFYHGTKDTGIHGSAEENMESILREGFRKGKSSELHREGTSLTRDPQIALSGDFAKGNYDTTLVVYEDRPLTQRNLSPAEYAAGLGDPHKETVPERFGTGTDLYRTGKPGVFKEDETWMNRFKEYEDVKRQINALEGERQRLLREMRKIQTDTYEELFDNPPAELKLEFLKRTADLQTQYHLVSVQLSELLKGPHVIPPPITGKRLTDNPQALKHAEQGMKAVKESKDFINNLWEPKTPWMTEKEANNFITSKRGRTAFKQVGGNRQEMKERGLAKRILSGEWRMRYPVPVSDTKYLTDMARVLENNRTSGKANFGRSMDELFQELSDAHRKTVQFDKSGFPLKAKTISDARNRLFWRAASLGKKEAMRAMELVDWIFIDAPYSYLKLKKGIGQMSSFIKSRRVKDREELFALKDFDYVTPVAEKLNETWRELVELRNDYPDMLHELSELLGKSKKADHTYSIWKKDRDTMWGPDGRIKKEFTEAD